MKRIKYIQLIRNKIIVGKCKLEINNNIAWLENVFIYKKFRGLGYSKFLIRKAINLMKRMKIERINLHVKYDNYIANKIKIIVFKTNHIININNMILNNLIITFKN